MYHDEGRLLVPEREIERMLVDFSGAYDPLSIQVFFSIRSLARRINDAATEWLAPFGLTATKYNYLAVLYANRDKGLSPTQISAVVHTVSGSVASMINALEREKLVKRHEHESDRRSAVIRLTARGERLFRNAADVHHQRIKAVVAELGDPVARTLLDNILQLGKVLQKQGPGA